MKPFGEAKRDFERTYVEQLLRKTGGSVHRAAQLAGKHRRTFYALMCRLGVDADMIRKEMRDAVPR